MPSSEQVLAVFVCPAVNCAVSTIIDAIISTVTRRCLSIHLRHDANSIFKNALAGLNRFVMSHTIDTIATIDNSM